MAWNTPEMKSSLSVPFPSIYFVCTWLICTAETWAEHTEEWLGELGRDLQGPMESCCFFLVETIFWATEGRQNIQAGKTGHRWKAGQGRRAHSEQHTNSRVPPPKPAPKIECIIGKVKGAGFPWRSMETLAEFSTRRMWLQKSHSTRWTPEDLGEKMTKNPKTRNSVPSPLCVYNTTSTKLIVANIFLLWEILLAERRYLVSAAKE